MEKNKKIYPVLFLSVIYCILQTDLPSIINNGDMNALKESSWTLMKCLLMIQAWWNPYLHYNGVTWFISAIMFLYLFDLPVHFLLPLYQNIKQKYRTIECLFCTFSALHYILHTYICFSSSSAQV